MALALFCAHCEFQIEDPFEVLQTERVTALSCERCRRPFWFVIAECERCADDVVRMWKSEPGPDALSRLSCEGCGHSLRRERDEDPEISSTADRR